MTLIEVLVTVVIIAIVLIPMSVVAYSTLNSSSSNASRQNAAVLATSVISKLEAASYPSVGFSSSELVAQSSNAPYAEFTSGANRYWDKDGDGDTTADSSDEQLIEVTTPAAFNLGPSPGVAFTPYMHITTTGTVYVVMTHIYWDSAIVPSCPGFDPATTVLSQAYVHVYVEVEWRNGTIGGETLTQDSVIYPGGQQPYNGPQASAAPAVPSILSATPLTVTGEIKVSWTLPTGWVDSPLTSQTSCFAVGWSNSNNVGFSSGLLSDSSLTVSGTSASYTVTGLIQGGVNQAYTFYVTAYAPNGTGSVESSDSQMADAPLGPVITAVTPASGSAGDSVKISGTGFSTPTMNVEFCPAGQSCTATFFAATGCALNSGSTTQYTCTAIVPAALSGSDTGVFNVVAETATGSNGGEITSPPTSESEFTYGPTVTGVSPPNGPVGADVTVSGTNLFPQTTFTFGSPSGTATPISCTSTFTSCDIAVPSGTSGATVDVQAVNGAVTSPVTSGDKFTYA